MLPRSLLLIAAATALVAQDDPSQRIDDIFGQWAKSGTPGASVAVIQNGKLVFQKGYGTANLEYDVPITADTVFHVASVSKQFTAMCIVLLEQDEKLTLEDDIHKHLPEMPDYGHRVTIRELLQHTSGIRDQWQTLGLAGWRLDDVITQDQILRLLFRQRELNFEPGSRHLYSNGGYTLLAEIVKRVSGKPLADFADARIFRPLGMTHTHVHDDHTRVVPNRAYSYELRRGEYVAMPLNYANAGATSLFTTAPDLTRWLDNFRDPKVGGPKAIARLEEQALLTNGTKVPYALGLSIGEYRGLRTISHGGSDAGYRSDVTWFPDQQLGIVVLSNLASFSPGIIANRVASVYLEKVMKPELPAASTPAEARTPHTPFDAEDLPRYPGTYWSDELETQYTIVLKDGKLSANHVRHGQIALSPTAKDQFRSTAWFMPEVKFLRDGGGAVMGMTLGGGRVTAIRFVRR